MARSSGLGLQRASAPTWLQLSCGAPPRRPARSGHCAGPPFGRTAVPHRAPMPSPPNHRIDNSLLPGDARPHSDPDTTTKTPRSRVPHLTPLRCPSERPQRTALGMRLFGGCRECNDRSLRISLGFQALWTSVPGLVGLGWASAGLRPGIAVFDFPGSFRIRSLIPSPPLGPSPPSASPSAS